MTTHIQLFGKPIALDDDQGSRPAMTITGVLDGYTSGEAYEGELQINNSVGFCSLQLLDGTNLPLDASVSIDNTTKKIIFQWKAPVDVTTTDVPGGDFETESAWDWQNGWRWITGYDHQSGLHSAGFADFKGNSWLPNTSMIPVIVGNTINAKVSVQQGGSSAGNVRAGVALQWIDSSRNVLSASVGEIITSGSNGEWHDSHISVQVPANAQWVRPIVFASRKRQNALLYVDDFTWDLSYHPGAQSDDTYPIRLKVTDSIGQVAYWSGDLSEYSINLTSQLYPLPFIREGIQAGLGMTDVRNTGVPIQSDDMQVGLGMTAISTTATVSYRTVTADAEPLQVGLGITSISTTTTVSYRTVTADAEPLQIALGMTSIGTTVVASYRTLTHDPIDMQTALGMTAISTTKV